MIPVILSSMLRQKVFAYITHAGRLLVFRHTDFPEAGIQVPAGSVEEGEGLAAAALREAQEETGLESLVLVAYLGEQVRDMSDFGLAEVHQRHFFHLRCDGAPPESWRHAELHPGDGSQAPIYFDFFWCSLTELPVLVAGHDSLLPALRQRLEKEP